MRVSGEEILISRRQNIVGLTHFAYYLAHGRRAFNHRLAISHPAITMKLATRARGEIYRRMSICIGLRRQRSIIIEAPTRSCIAANLCQEDYSSPMSDIMPIFAPASTEYSASLPVSSHQGIDRCRRYLNFSQVIDARLRARPRPGNNTRSLP